MALRFRAAMAKQEGLKSDKQASKQPNKKSTYSCVFAGSRSLVRARCHNPGWHVWLRGEGGGGLLQGHFPGNLHNDLLAGVLIFFLDALVEATEWRPRPLTHPAESIPTVKTVLQRRGCSLLGRVDTRKNNAEKKGTILLQPSSRLIITEQFGHLFLYIAKNCS